MNELAAIVRGSLPKLARAVLCALITIDVHARDMVTDMVKHEVNAVTNFDWQKQLRFVTSPSHRNIGYAKMSRPSYVVVVFLRYYWDLEMDNCIVRMSNSIYIYGYEYLGASPRLVITPLTVLLRKARKM